MAFENNGYKIGFFILFTVLLLGLGGVGGWWYFSKQPVATLPPPENVPVVTTMPSVPTDSVEPTITLQPSITNQPTISDIDGIIQAMAAKHSRPVGEVHLSVNKNTGTHAQGVVKFGDEMAGGWFLAAKVNNEWVIVQDGNGTISCELIEPYDFPVSMAEECVDNNGNLIKR